MSISPTDVKGSSKPSFQAQSENPSFDHGLLQFSQAHSSPDFSETNSQSSRSVQISGPGSFSNLSVSNPVSVVASAAAADSCGSSKRVSDLRTPEARKGSHSQNQGASSRCHSTHRGTSSQFRSVEFDRKLSGTVSSSYNDHLAAGSGTLLGNIKHSGARKSQIMNGNHLLNFHYDPISRPQSKVPKAPPRRQQKIKPYNKDLFLQANYKFIVLDVGSHEIKSMDPDKMLQWEDVICVRYSTPFPVQCPICLEGPLCPQITSCGHIFCFPCILRYLFMGGEDYKGDHWKKCPLCFMMISSKDLYTIYIDHVEQYKVGDHVNFTLLTRPKDSLIPSQKDQDGTEGIPYSSDGLSDSFSKFTLTSDVELSVREAKLELMDWLAKAESGHVVDLERLPYVCAALEQLEQRKKCWIEYRALSSCPPLKNHATPYSNFKTCQCTPHKTEPNALSFASIADDSEAVESASGALCIGCKDESSGLDAVSLEKIDGDAGLVNVDVSESLEGPEKLSVSSDEDKGIQRQSSSCKDSRDDSYTFYQAIDGQLLILHPLNMKCLLRYYGCHDLLPSRIGGEILQLETVTQSEAMRRRYRYLSHFSLTTTFQLCEIDLGDILPPDALSPFIDEIKKRESQRKRLAKKENEEKAREKAAAMHERRVLSNFQYSGYNDATFSMDDFEALGNSVVPSTSPPVVGERKLFSDVTRLGFAAAHDSPSLRTEESANASSNTELTCEATSPTVPRSVATLSFAKAISSTAAVAGGPEVSKINGFGKKGKKGSRVLLSTASGRRY